MKNTILLLLGTLAIVACHKNENENGDGDKNPPNDVCDYKSEIMAPAGYNIHEISSIYFTGYFKTFQFVNPAVGFALGSTMTEGYVAVLKTLDGGKHWTDLNINIPQRPISMTFKNSSLGIISVKDLTGCPAPNCANKCVVLKTIDGGISWSEMEISNFKGVLHGLQFDEAGKLFAILKLEADSKIVTSDDDGATWKILFESPELPISVKSFQILKGNIYVGGNLGAILVIDINGALSKKINAINSLPFGFNMIDEDNIIMSIYIGLFKSKDGGATWDLISEENGRVIDFPTADKGIMLLSKSACLVGNIYMADDVLAATKNGGTSWIEAAVPSTNLSLSFIGSQKIETGKYRLLFWNKLYELSEN